MIETNVADHGDVTLVAISGRVDSMNASQFGEALSTQIDGGNVQIVLDLSSVEYMSSAGLREIVNSLKKVKRAQGDLRLAQPSQRVREVLEMAGLDTIFRIYDTQSEAVHSFNHAG
ncbi:MAG: STAS domain-containing protein [Anaerolineae bacterium]|nr:STAS domain-containing protein [Anaerolineae bacterium]